MTEFEAIYKEYFRDVYLYILGLSQNEHIAEEITEETFFKALKALDVKVNIKMYKKRKIKMYIFQSNLPPIVFPKRLAFL